MTDLSATEVLDEILFAHLDGQIAGATVLQHVPQDLGGTIVVIGAVESNPGGGKGEDDERISLTIGILFDGEERKPITVIQARLKHLLHDVTLEGHGWSFRIFQLSASASLAPDEENDAGEGYLGLSQFSIDASRA